MNLAWSDTVQVSPLFPVPCSQDSPVCLTESEKTPQVFLLFSECEFPKQNQSVGLACLVFGNHLQSVEISWNSTAKYKNESAFPLKKLKPDDVMSSQLSLWASELNGTHTCIVTNNSKVSAAKTFQLPGEYS